LGKNRCDRNQNQQNRSEQLLYHGNILLSETQ